MYKLLEYNLGFVSWLEPAIGNFTDEESISIASAGAGATASAPGTTTTLASPISGNSEDQHQQSDASEGLFIGRSNIGGSGSGLPDQQQGNHHHHHITSSSK